jgi:periplasmic protein TonB
MATTEIQKLSLLARFFQKEYFSHGSRLSHAKLDLFILIAFLLHISIVTFELIAPLDIKKPPPPIKVKYVNTQKPKLLKQKKLSDDSLKVNQNKKTKSSKLIASAKPKTLVKQQSQKQKKHRKKPTISKTHSSPNIIKQSKAPALKRKKTPSQQKKSTSPSVLFSQKETLSMLDGFHPEKYAAQDFPIEEREVLDSDEPISLDTKDKKYTSYFGRIKQQIQRAWIYPAQGTKKRLSGEVTLRFEISKGGNLLDLRLINTSGVDILDINAIKAVKEAAPYYPFPKTILKKKLSILATFVYSAN